MPTDPASSTCVNGDICIPPSANPGYGPGFIVQNCFRRLICTLLLDKVMWKQWENFLVEELMPTSRIKMGWDHITDGRLTFQLSSFQCTLGFLFIIFDLTYHNLIPTCTIVHLSCYLKKTLSGFKLKTYKQNHPFIVEKNENNHQKCTFTIVFGYTAKPDNFWIMLSIIGTIFDFVSFHYQRTALHIAAKEGQKVIMEILVDKEADVNMKDNDEV